MKLYCLFLLVGLIRLSKAKNSPLLLNGHYITWPSNRTKEKFINNKQFIPKNIIYTRFQLCSNRVFLAAPRYKHGVPFTLGYAVLNENHKFYNYVKPFPCLEDQVSELRSVCDSGSLINVVDLVMGQDSILWVLDIGISDTLSGNPSRDGDPKVVAFDLTTKKIQHKISLHSLTNQNQSRFHNLVVEYVNNSKTVLYVGDGGTGSIIVWYVQRNEGYRSKLPLLVKQSCADTLKNDVFYIALIEQQAGNFIYLTYLFGEDLFRTKTKDLRIHINPMRIVSLGKKPYEMVVLGSGYGSPMLYFRFKNVNHMYSWDTNLNFLEENFMMARKCKDCRTITHVDINNDGVLWILESNILDFVNDHVGSFGSSMLLMPVIEPPAHLISDEPSKTDYVYL